MSIVSDLELIRRVPLFATMTADQAAILSEALSKRRFKRGEHIVQQGEKSDALYIILAGRARVVMADNKGREVILATVRPGDYIGELSLIDEEPHSASVEAEVQTDVFVLRRSEFNRCLESNGSMGHSIMQCLSRRLREATRKIGSLALMGVYGRVADVLLGGAVAVEGSAMMICEKISRQDIAKMVGASREMVSRVMREFEEEGFIQTREDGSILVSERHALPRW